MSTSDNNVTVNTMTAESFVLNLVDSTKDKVLSPQNSNVASENNREKHLKELSRQASEEILASNKFDLIINDFVSSHLESDMENVLEKLICDQLGTTSDPIFLSACSLWAAIEFLDARVEKLIKLQESLEHLAALQLSLIRFEAPFLVKAAEKNLISIFRLKRIDHSNNKVFQSDDADNQVNEKPSYEIKSRKIESEYRDKVALLHKAQLSYLQNWSTEKLAECRELYDQTRNFFTAETDSYKSTFLNAIKAAAACSSIISSLKIQIGHRELRQEAEMHFGIAVSLFKELDIDFFENENFDPLGVKVQTAVKTMIFLGEHKYAVEKLVFDDQRLRRRTSNRVVGFIFLALVLAAFFTLFGPFNFHFSDGVVAQGQIACQGNNACHLRNLEPYFLGIPWVVMVWSLIGSMASMIHRFNKMPIYEFTDLLKWLITRPVQGMVLGAAFYYILNANLFTFTSTADSTSSTGNGVQGDYLTLLLCFLIGFSDRFADGIFDFLVNKFGGSSSPQAENTNVIIPNSDQNSSANSKNKK